MTTIWLVSSMIHKMFPRLLAAITLPLLLLGVSAPALAQSTLKSSSFILDGVNFGSNFTLTSGQSTVPPTISSDGPSVTELTPTTAVVTWVTDKASTSTVQFGTTTAYGKEIGTSDLVTEHEVTLFGLTSETEYHYRVKSVDAFSGTTLSEDGTFTTPAEAGINSIKISDVTYTSALVSWTTGLFTGSTIEYGTTTRYGSSKTTSSRSFLTEHTIQLTDLSPGSDYHFRIVATDEEGNTTRSNDFLFTTLANPVIESITVTPQINETTIAWRTNVFTTGIISYQSPKDTKELSAGDTTLTSNHSVVLKNLFGQTTYNFTILATDSQGKQVTSTVRTFQTQTDTVAPEISDLKVAVTRSGQELVLTVTWKTNEPATSKVSYAPKTDADNITDLPAGQNLVSQHLIVSTGLLASTPYTLKAIAADSFGNTAEETINFVSPGLSKSIFQLILDNVLNAFGPFIKLFGTE